MTFTVRGLDPDRFAALFTATPKELAAHRAEWVTVDSETGFPCRVSLENARPGEAVMLLNYAHLDKETPFHASHAIYVREGVSRAADHVDVLPPALAARNLGLRGFTGDGYLHDGELAFAGEADAGIARLLADPAVAYVDIHSAAYGCFLARAERS